MLSRRMWGVGEEEKRKSVGLRKDKSTLLHTTFGYLGLWFVDTQGESSYLETKI